MFWRVSVLILTGTLKILLLCVLKFMPMAQICAKTPKFETSIFLFLRTHAGGLLRVNSTTPPPIFNRFNKALLCLPNYIQLVTYVLYISWKKVYFKNSGLYCRWTHCLKFQKDWKTKIRNWRVGSRYKILLHLISGAFTSQVKI